MVSEAKTSSPIALTVKLEIGPRFGQIGRNQDFDPLKNCPFRTCDLSPGTRAAQTPICLAADAPILQIPRGGSGAPLGEKNT